jgi:hypothetical protein
LLLAVANRSYVSMYDTFTGQLVIAVVVGLFAIGFIWLRRLAKYETPQRFLASNDSDKPGVPAEVPETVARWQGQTPANGTATTADPRGGAR